jgi:hypothetical protein
LGHVTIFEFLRFNGRGKLFRREISVSRLFVGGKELQQLLDFGKLFQCRPVHSHTEVKLPDIEKPVFWHDCFLTFRLQKNSKNSCVFSIIIYNDSRLVYYPLFVSIKIDKIQRFAPLYRLSSEVFVVPGNLLKRVNR